MASAEDTLVYVGGYAPAGTPGIRVFRLHTQTGALSEIGTASGLANPSFLELHPTGAFLYAANEIGEFGGRSTGAVSAFAVGEDGLLTPINQEASEGNGPCHISLDSAGSSVLVANYGGGSVARLPLGKDGSLQPATGTAKHEGPSRTHPGRQENCHAHSINSHPSGRFAVACDLGADKLLIYWLTEDGGLEPNDPAFTATQPGAGPRHLTFSTDGRFAYVINELNNTLSAYAVDAEAGTLTEVQTVSTLPEGFEGRSSTAEVKLHPSGRFLYGSNRGHDSIAIFAVDAETGRLTPTGYEPTQGRSPRNFNIDPSGTLLIAANQESDSLVVFQIDGKTGQLTPAGQTVTLPKPVCVRFLECD